MGSGGVGGLKPGVNGDVFHVPDGAESGPRTGEAPATRRVASRDVVESAPPVSGRPVSTRPQLGPPRGTLATRLASLRRAFAEGDAGGLFELFQGVSKEDQKRLIAAFGEAKFDRAVADLDDLDRIQLQAYLRNATGQLEPHDEWRLSVEGMGTFEAGIIESLRDLTSAQIEHHLRRYQDVYEEDFEDRIVGGLFSELGGSDKIRAKVYLRGRDSLTPAHHTALDLYLAGEGRWGTATFHLLENLLAAHSYAALWGHSRPAHPVEKHPVGQGSIAAAYAELGFGDLNDVRSEFEGAAERMAIDAALLGNDAPAADRARYVASMIAMFVPRLVGSGVSADELVSVLAANLVPEGQGSPTWSEVEEAIRTLPAAAQRLRRPLLEEVQLALGPASTRAKVVGVLATEGDPDGGKTLALRVYADTVGRLGSNEEGLCEKLASASPAARASADAFARRVLGQSLESMIVRDLSDTPVWKERALAHLYHGPLPPYAMLYYAGRGAAESKEVMRAFRDHYRALPLEARGELRSSFEQPKVEVVLDGIGPDREAVRSVLIEQLGFDPVDADRTLADVPTDLFGVVSVDRGADVEAMLREAGALCHRVSKDPMRFQDAVAELEDQDRALLAMNLALAGAQDGELKDLKRVLEAEQERIRGGGWLGVSGTLMDWFGWSGRFVDDAGRRLYDRMDAMALGPDGELDADSKAALVDAVAEFTDRLQQYHHEKGDVTEVAADIVVAVAVMAVAAGWAVYAVRAARIAQAAAAAKAAAAAEATAAGTAAAGTTAAGTGTAGAVATTTAATTAPATVAPLTTSLSGALSQISAPQVATTATVGAAARVGTKEAFLGNEYDVVSPEAAGDVFIGAVDGGTMSALLPLGKVAAGSTVRRVVTEAGLGATFGAQYATTRSVVDPETYTPEGFSAALDRIGQATLLGGVLTPAGSTALRGGGHALARGAHYGGVGIKKLVETLAPSRGLTAQQIQQGYFELMVSSSPDATDAIRTTLAHLDRHDPAARDILRSINDELLDRFPRDQRMRRIHDAWGRALRELSAVERRPWSAPRPPQQLVGELSREAVMHGSTTTRYALRTLSHPDEIRTFVEQFTRSHADIGAEVLELVAQRAPKHTRDAWRAAIAKARRSAMPPLDGADVTERMHATIREIFPDAGRDDVAHYLALATNADVPLRDAAAVLRALDAESPLARLQIAEILPKLGPRAQSQWRAALAALPEESPAAWPKARGKLRLLRALNERVTRDVVAGRPTYAPQLILQLPRSPEEIDTILRMIDFAGRLPGGKPGRDELMLGLRQRLAFDGRGGLSKHWRAALAAREAPASLSDMGAVAAVPTGTPPGPMGPLAGSGGANPAELFAMMDRLGVAPLSANVNARPLSSVLQGVRAHAARTGKAFHVAAVETLDNPQEIKEFIDHFSALFAPAERALAELGYWSSTLRLNATARQAWSQALGARTMAAQQRAFAQMAANASGAAAPGPRTSALRRWWESTLMRAHQPIARPTRPITAQTARQMDERAVNQLKEMGVGFRRVSPDDAQPWAFSAPGDVEPGALAHMNLYEVTSVPARQSAANPSLPALLHPEMAKQFEELKKAGYRLFVDPSMGLFGAGGMHANNPKVMHLAPGARFDVFLHENRHRLNRAVFEAIPYETLEADLSRGLRPIAAAPDDIQRLVRAGLPRTAADETLAVAEQVEAFLRAGYHRSRIINIYRYGRRHQITSILNIPAAQRTPAQSMRLYTAILESLLGCDVQHIASRVRPEHYAFASIIAGAIAADREVIVKRYDNMAHFMVQMDTDEWVSLKLPASSIPQVIEQTPRESRRGELVWR